MTIYEAGDVVLVPFPFSNLLATKKRPAIAISSLNYNTLSSDIIIIAITSQISDKLGIGEFNLKGWKSAGLLKKSSVKPAITTIEQNLIIKKLGKISPEDAMSLNFALQKIFEI